MRFIRTLVMLVAIACIAYCGATVRLGDRTFFGHLVNIWHSNQTQDLVKGVKQSSRPMVNRVTRGVKAGLRAAEQPDRTDAHAGERRGDPGTDAGPTPSR